MRLLGLSKLDLILWALLAVCLAGLGAVVLKWKHDSGVLKVERVEHRNELAQLKKEQQSELEHAREAVAIAQENARLAWEASNDYQQKLEDLKRARADTPVRTVRLCLDHEFVSAAAGGSDAPGPEGLPQAPGPDPRVSRDIGPELYELADQADQCAVQRDALIRFNETTK